MRGSTARWPAATTALPRSLTNWRRASCSAAGPTRQVGTYVDPADWNDLIAAPDTLVLDTRNAFEVAMGTFEGAVDPGIKSFGQFKDFAARHLDSVKHRKIAMF